MIFFGENEILIVLYSTFEDGNFCFGSEPFFYIFNTETSGVSFVNTDVVITV